jgi:hypothetical protein
VTGIIGAVEPRAPGVPARALLTPSLGLGLLGLPEVIVESSRVGGGVGTGLLGVAAAAWGGLVYGVLAGAVVYLVSLRGPAAWTRARVVPAVERTPGLILVLAVALLALVPGSEFAVQTVADHPLNNRSAEAAVVQLGTVLLGVPALVFSVLLARGLDSRLVGTRFASPAARGGLLVVLMAAAFTVIQHNGLIQIYGGPLAAVLLVLALLAAAAMLPHRVELANRGGLALIGGTLVSTFVLGLVGLHDRPARARLFHDSRVFATVAEAAYYPWDWDGDDDVPTWLGGGDCDNLDPERTAWGPDVPGTAVDENCTGTVAPKLPLAVPQQDPLTDKLPILLITMDTVRTDRLASGGYPRDTMPVLDAYAGKGRLYTHGYSASNGTAISLLALVSGQSPERMKALATLAGHEGRQVHNTWLPTQLHHLGYETVGISPPMRFLWDATPSPVPFDRVDVVSEIVKGNITTITSDQVADAAIRNFERGVDGRFFWIHFLDPHAPHVAPARFPGSTPQDAYDNELAWLDQHLGRVLDSWERETNGRGLAIITADHGESFGERGIYGHSQSLYELEVRVPMVVRGVGVVPGVDDRPVSSISVAPTIMAALGHSDPRHSTTTLEDARAPILYARRYRDVRHEVALVEGAWKLMWNRRWNTVLLFNLDEDPQEHRDRTRSEPARVDAMLAELRRRLDEG